MIRNPRVLASKGGRSDAPTLNPVSAVGGARLGVDTALSNPLSFTVLLTLVAVYYLFLLSNGTLLLFAPEILDKAFDSMLVHLLRGEFTVDRDAKGSSRCPRL